MSQPVDLIEQETLTSEIVHPWSGGDYRLPGYFSSSKAKFISKEETY
jgi:hypothetical protein